MNKHVTFVVAAAVFALLLSGAPVVAQNQGNGKGQGPIAVSPEFCPRVFDECDDNPNVFGACVAFVNSCLNPGRGNDPECCAKCFEFSDLCGIEETVFCTPCL